MVKKLLISLGLLFLAACAPAANEGLPTLVRFPSETQASGQLITNPTEIAQLRTSLPATFTPTFSPTASPTLDPSVTASLTSTVTVTASATITDTPSPTATFPPPLPPEDRPILAFAMTAYAATVLPSDFQVPPYIGVDVTLAPTQNATITGGATGVIVISGQATQPIQNIACPSLPTGGFLTVFQSNPDIAALLGCPNGTVQTSVPAASQSYQQGTMIWLNGEILAFYNLTDVFESYPDTFTQGVDPETSTEVPPSGLLAPIRGFLKVWANNPSVRTNLGWATLGEQGSSGTVQQFANGRMIYLTGRNEILVLIGTSTGRWLAFQGQY